MLSDNKNTTKDNSKVNKKMKNSCANRFEVLKEENSKADST